MPESLLSGNRSWGENSRRSSKSNLDLAEKIAGAFGKRVVWIKIGDRYTTNRLVVRESSFSSKVFIDVRCSPLPAHVSPRHELLHHMKKESPAVYSDLVDTLTPLQKNTISYGRINEIAFFTRQVLSILLYLSSGSV